LRALGLDVTLFDEKEEVVIFEQEEDLIAEDAQIPEEDKISELNTNLHETDEEVEKEVQGEIPEEQDGEV